MPVDLSPFNPKDLGRLVDELDTRRHHRLQTEKVLEDCKKREDEMKQLVLAALAAAGLDGARGRHAQVTRKLTPTPVVKDWALFYAYVKKQGAFDLLHRRLTTTAVLERWEQGVKIPGLDQEQRLTLHVTSLRREV